MARPRNINAVDLVYTALCCRRLRPIEATVLRRTQQDWREMLEYQCAAGRGCKAVL